MVLNNPITTPIMMLPSSNLLLGKLNVKIGLYKIIC